MEDRTERTGGLFRAVVFIVMLVTLGAAIARLIESSQVTGSSLSEADAVALGPCLPSDTLKPDLQVKLAQPVATAMNQALIVEYFASAAAPPFALDKVDASSNTLKQGQPLEMTGGTVRVRSQALVKFDGKTFILSVAKGAPLDFKIADEDTVIVRAGGKIAVDPSTHKLVDSKAPVGTVAIGKDIDVTTTGDVTGNVFDSTMLPVLQPVRVFGDKGPNAFEIEVQGSAAQGGVQSPRNVTGCVVYSDGTGRQGMKLSVSEPSTREGRPVIYLNLPSSALPDEALWSPIGLMLNNDGVLFYGGYPAIGRLPAAAIATLLTGFVFWSLLHVRHLKTMPDATVRKGDWSRWFAGLFISEDDNDPSLSLFQVFFWTVVAVWGLIYAFAVNGSLIHMTNSMLVLLGLSGASSVVARWVSSSRGVSTSRAAGDSGAQVDTSPVAIWQMLNTGGKFDLLKLQMLIFTLLTGIYVLSRIADTAAFPDLDTQTLLLMGVSHGIYLGGKIGSTSEFSDAKVSLAEADEADQAVQAKSAELADLKSKQDALNAELATLNAQLDTANKIVAPAPIDTAFIASLKISIAEKQKSLKDLDAAVAVKKDEFIKLTKDSADTKSALAKKIADLGLTHKGATPEPKKN